MFLPMLLMTASPLQAIMGVCSVTLHNTHDLFTSYHSNRYGCFWHPSPVNAQAYRDETRLSVPVAVFVAVQVMR